MNALLSEETEQWMRSYSAIMPHDDVEHMLLSRIISLLEDIRAEMRENGHERDVAGGTP